MVLSADKRLLTEARRNVINGVAGIDVDGDVTGPSGKLATITGAQLTAILARLTALETNAPQIVLPVGGAFPNRAITPRCQILLSSTVIPTWGGTITSGTGYVSGFDILIKANA
jgi:hypothetical protein